MSKELFRKFFHIGNLSLSLEAALANRISLKVDTHEDLTFCFAFFLQLYFTIDSRTINKWIYNHNLDGFAWGSSLYWDKHHGLNFYIEAGHDWTGHGKKGFRFSLDITDLLKGRSKYFNEVLETRDLEIPMLEKSYPCTIKLERRTWTFPRWFKIVNYGADIQIPGGIPFPGKGENSWDCGDDGLWGMSCNAKTIPEAIAKVVQSVYETRIKRGGYRCLNWDKRNEAKI